MRPASSIIPAASLVPPTSIATTTLSAVGVVDKVQHNLVAIAAHDRVHELKRTPIREKGQPFRSQAQRAFQHAKKSGIFRLNENRRVNLAGMRRNQSESLVENFV